MLKSFRQTQSRCPEEEIEENMSDDFVLHEQRCVVYTRRRAASFWYYRSPVTHAISQLRTRTRRRELHERSAIPALVHVLGRRVFSVSSRK
jgi:hypothetical protein